jgi:hypothetical protein
MLWPKVPIIIPNIVSKDVYGMPVQLENCFKN